MAKEKNPKDSIFKRFGGSLANAVENLIFSHEEVEEKLEKPEEKTASPESNAPQPPARHPDTENARVNHKLVQAILESAEELGPALTQFRGYLAELEQIIPDEGTRYKAAFATYNKASKKSVADLLSAADEQIASLENEKKDFMTGVRDKADELNALKQEMVNIDKEIKELEERIAELTEFNEKKASQSKKLNNSIQHATVRFENALAAVEAILKEKRARLEKHLKGM